MKRILALFLLLCVCIGLCACANEESPETTEPTVPIETIDERPLLNDSDNGAKAQMNVGKGTTIHGVVTYIGTSSCTIQLIVPKNTLVYVEMPMDQLAKLSKNTFISIEGIVSAFNANGDGKYTIRGEKILSYEEMDTWVKERITQQYNFNCLFDKSNYAFIGVLDEFDIGLLYTYAELSGDMFRIRDDTKMKEYLVGDWHCGTNIKNVLSDCKFGNTGGYYLDWGQGSSGSGKWTVKNGRLDMDTTSIYIEDISGPVYVLSDDIFILEGILFARKK